VPEDTVLTLALALGTGWLLIVVGVIAMFRIAARSDEVLASAVRQAGAPTDGGQPVSGRTPAVGRPRRRLNAVETPAPASYRLAGRALPPAVRPQPVDATLA
jgi:hypothetical protein